MAVWGRTIGQKFQHKLSLNWLTPLPNAFSNRPIQDALYPYLVFCSFHVTMWSLLWLLSHFVILVTEFCHLCLFLVTLYLFYSCLPLNYYKTNLMLFITFERTILHVITNGYWLNSALMNHISFKLLLISILLKGASNFIYIRTKNQKQTRIKGIEESLPLYYDKHFLPIIYPGQKMHWAKIKM